MEAILEEAGSFAPLIVSCIKAIVVIIIGWSAAGVVSGFIRRRLGAVPNIDRTLASFIASIAKWAILLMVAAAVLGFFGVEATSLVAIMGAATLAIGLALQGTLSDLAAGFMLILFRPYKLDQYVDIGGTTGTVKDLNLFVTELVTPDNLQIIIPNGQAWGAIITNYSAHPKRRLDMVFGIDYGDSADKAMQIILDIAKNEPRVDDDPAAWVRVTNLGDSSVDLTLRVWCDVTEYWNLRFDMIQTIKEAFDAQGISIPYPHTVEIQKQE